MVKGTLRMRASVWASSVLPEPVGPSRRMLDFCSSTSSTSTPALDALVVVVDGDGERLLGPLLPDHVLVEDGLDLGRARDAQLLVALLLAGDLLGDDVVAQPDALVADVDGRPGDELLHLLLRLPAEGAAQGLSLLRSGHLVNPSGFFASAAFFVTITSSMRPYSLASCGDMK